MKLFLDDLRQPPPGWTLFRWPHEAIRFLEAGGVTHVSLDHDLGDDTRDTGYDVIVWIGEAVALRGFIPPEVVVHSASTPARQRMEQGSESVRKLAARRSGDR